MLSDTLDMNGGAAITGNLARNSRKTPDTRIISCARQEFKKNFSAQSVADINL